MLNLTIDIGNTRTKIGLFQGTALKEKQSFLDFDLDVLKHITYNHSIQKVILSSVKEVAKNMEVFLRENFQYWRLATSTALPIENRYDTPETLGKDRIAAIMGAFYLFPHQNNLIIDAGTCITMDILTKEHAYLGGNITPGVDMRLKAMQHFTAKLPSVKRGQRQKLWGTSTETAMRNGGQFGAVLEMRAFIKSCQRKFGRLNVLLTGGDADFFAKNLKTKIFVEPNLVLIGLNEILSYNVELSEK